KTNRPNVPDIKVASCPVCSLVTVTSTPDTTAPLASCTVPSMIPVVSVPNTRAPGRNRNKKNASTANGLLCILFTRRARFVALRRRVVYTGPLGEAIRLRRQGGLRTLVESPSSSPYRIGQNGGETQSP